MSVKRLMSIGISVACTVMCTHAFAQSLRESTSAVAKDGTGSGAGSWIGYMFGSNQANGTNSAVAAGSNNVATAAGAFVGAGSYNSADGVSSLVIGGFDNHATFSDAMVGAGAGNRATGARSVVVGGGYNLASGNWSFIGGGGRQTGSGLAGAAAQDHVAAGKWSTIGGGMGNRSGTGSVTGSTVTGGEQNQALGTDATVAGGTLNVANASYASVAGGRGNTATGSGAAVGGGTGNTASGIGATVPGGSANVASGNYSFAAGQRAKSPNPGSFAFADGSPFDFNTIASNEFAARATGGVRFVTAIDGSGASTAGVTLTAGGGSWTSLSDRAAKQDLVAVNGASILSQLATMPVYVWRYKTEVSRALHMGPTAQDFQAAFGLGDSDKRITTVDAQGVSLAAAQALYHELQRQDDMMRSQEADLATLERRLADLDSIDERLSAIRSAVLQLMRHHSVRTTPTGFLQP